MTPHHETVHVQLLWKITPGHYMQTIGKKNPTD